MHKTIFFYIAIVCLTLNSALSLAQDPPDLKALLKPHILKKVMEDREVASRSWLDDAGKQYQFYVSALVKATPKQTRAVLTDYPLYAKMVPYFDKSEFNGDQQTIKMEGGIWKFRFNLVIRFEEMGERWLKFKILSGSFAGLTGDMMFESQGEKGTLVYLAGSLTDYPWPPRIVMEKGAEIVFDITAKKMRSLIEKRGDEPKNNQPIQNSQGTGQESKESDNKQEKKNDAQVPRPRTRL